MGNKERLPRKSHDYGLAAVRERAVTLPERRGSMIVYKVVTKKPSGALIIARACPVSDCFEPIALVQDTTPPGEISRMVGEHMLAAHPGEDGDSPSGFSFRAGVFLAVSEGDAQVFQDMPIEHLARLLSPKRRRARS